MIIPPTFPWNFSFFYFTPGKNFRQQNKAQPLAIFHKIVLDSLEIPRSKTKIPGNSTLFFLCYPWKFHFVFNYALPCGDQYQQKFYNWLLLFLLKKCKLPAQTKSLLLVAGIFLVVFLFPCDIVVICLCPTY